MSEALAAEVARLERWKSEALVVMEGLHDLGRVLGVPLGELVTGPVALDLATKLQADLADLRSRLGCIEEATRWDRPYDTRLDAVRGMCDLTQNGFTPIPEPPVVPVRVDQTIFADDPDRKGNCVAACIATLFGLDIGEVPHFVEFGIALGDDDVANVSHGNHWWAMLLGFLSARGCWPIELASVTEAESTELVLVAGMSPRGVMHQVIYRAGSLWYDPHPSRAGVLDVREVLAVRPLSWFDHNPTSVEVSAGE